ncbi:hypothetical protein N1851_023799 [Merluccius polli]|uniref:Uncharacterized protein n=1 Tax=Merluccius polli TaxID=89951 RepID=A0AA47MG82_MERPO|nr:hypothetical protein N1851_023799 [Merluccius polli]
MPLTAAEKQRRYRARRDQDQERREQYILWEKEKYKRDREQGKKKSIEECNEAEKVLRRRRWRADQAKTSAARKATAAAVNSLYTPPESPEQRRVGRKRSKQHQKKITSLLLRLEKELKRERKHKEKFKKRCQRLKKQQISPRSKINRELRSSPIVVRKRLLFHAALTNDLRARYQNATGEKERQLIAKICAGGLRKFAEAALGFSKKRWRMSGKEPLAFQRKGNARTGETIKTCVREYFERDDVSRLTTGKKQTKTKSKLKKQKTIPP